MTLITKKMFDQNNSKKLELKEQKVIKNRCQTGKSFKKTNKHQVGQFGISILDNLYDLLDFTKQNIINLLNQAQFNPHFNPFCLNKSLYPKTRFQIQKTVLSRKSSRISFFFGKTIKVHKLRCLQIFHLIQLPFTTGQLIQFIDLQLHFSLLYHQKRVVNMQGLDLYTMKVQAKILIICLSILNIGFTFQLTPIRKPSFNLTQKCIDVLPYKPLNINHNFYYTWFGKVGQNINGTTYETGHVFSRHIAVNYRCTDEQKQQNKTVFYDENEFYKALMKDTTNCTMTSEKQFNFRQNHNIAAASDYIKGIDCITGVVHTFPSYFVEFKRAIQNAKPTQAQYMASNHATVWTFYPKR